MFCVLPVRDTVLRFLLHKILKALKNRVIHLFVIQMIILIKQKNLCFQNGSKASPKLGGNASAADYAKNFNHKFIPFSPALCPVEVKSDVLKSLKGLRATGKVELDNGRILRSEVGEIQFTEKALSGICIFNLSVLSKKGMKIHIDFLNNYSFSEILSLLEQNRNLFADENADCLLNRNFSKKARQAVMKMAGFTNFSDKCRDIPNIQLKKIASICKNTEFEVTANCGFDQAQAALGGVCGMRLMKIQCRAKRQKDYIFAVRQSIFAATAEGIICILLLQADIWQVQTYD